MKYTFYQAKLSSEIGDEIVVARNGHDPVYVNAQGLIPGAKNNGVFTSPHDYEGEFMGLKVWATSHGLEYEEELVEKEFDGVTCDIVGLDDNFEDVREIQKRKQVEELEVETAIEAGI